MQPAAKNLCLLPRPRKLNLRAGFCAQPSCKTYIDPHAFGPQGYRLTISPDGVTLVAGDEAGAFYGRQTLRQIQSQSSPVPCLEIEDSPDFPVRGVMLDISRDKVPTMATLFALIDLLAGWKINQLQLYTEHTFAYAGHEEVWKNASPMTAAEIRQLDEYCRARFIELVPNQNSFGHMERWLRHPRYRHLAESADGADTPWGYRWKGPFSLCPTDAKSLDLLRDLYDQLLPNFSSRLFNVGCDETFDIGQGRSKPAAAAKGARRVYLEFLKELHAMVTNRGRTTMFWGDIILHEPSLIGELPRPIVALEWGYEADHPFDQEGKLFAESGIPFYVCPGTSSWLSIAGRTDNMWANQLNAAENGLKHGAVGFLNTDWGDHGHLQYLPISYAGFAAGAALSWCVQSNRDLDLAAALTAHTDVHGALACDLGNVYRSVGKELKNSTALFRILVPTSTHKDVMEGITIDGLARAQAEIGQIMQRHAGMAGLIADEYANAALMLTHACRRGMWKLDPTCQSARQLSEETERIVREHCRLWLARNRSGGLEDSANRLALDDDAAL